MQTQTQPNLFGRARSRKQAYELIMQEYLAGRLGATEFGSCVYDDGEGRHCSVGCLFSPEQLADIKARKLNNEPLSVLENALGAENLEWATGLPVAQLYQLQRVHDSSWSSARKARKGSFFHDFIQEQIEFCSMDSQ